MQSGAAHYSPLLSQGYIPFIQIVKLVILNPKPNLLYGEMLGACDAGALHHGLLSGLYGRHALPMLELYREKKDGWRVGAASNRAGNVEEYLLI